MLCVAVNTEEDVELVRYQNELDWLLRVQLVLCVSARSRTVQA